MYLRTSKYVSGYEFSGEKDKTDYKELIDLFNAGAFVSDDTPSATVSLTVAYWRKANQIHGWFVRECQDGVDECQETYVSREKLTELLELCQVALADRGAAVPAGLQPTQGFFFGSYDVDEWYWRDLEDTVKQLTRVLNSVPDDWDFEYQSSW